MRDVTSGKGGFCILETNDTDLDSQYGYAYIDTSGDAPVADTSTVYNVGTRSTLFYGLTEAEFGKLATAWEDMPAPDWTDTQGVTT